MIPIADDFNNFIILRQLQSEVEHYESSDSRKYFRFFFKSPLEIKGLFNVCTVLKQNKEHLMNLMNVKL